MIKILSILLLTLFTISVFAKINTHINQTNKGKTYLKGALHMHSTMSDGELTPEEAARFYKSLGYDFYTFTDHNNNYIPEKTFSKPIEGLICIPGAEVDFADSNYFKNLAAIHLNGIDYIGEFKDPEVTTISQTIDKFIKKLYELGAIPQVNHPNWSLTRGYSFNYAELLDINVPYLLEMNVCWDCNNKGDNAFEGCEYIWDALLAHGKTVYITMTEDRHQYYSQRDFQKTIYDLAKTTYGMENGMEMYMKEIYKALEPGHGFVMVRAEKNKASIRESLISGDFYASNGLYIDKYEYDNKSIKVSVKNQNGESNRIIFKGRMGYPLKIVDGNEGVYEFKNIPEEAYVRVKVINGDSKVAYLQPIFRDGRKSRIEL